MFPRFTLNGADAICAPSRHNALPAAAILAIGTHADMVFTQDSVLEHGRPMFCNAPAPLSAPPRARLVKIAPHDRTFLLVKILPPSRRPE